MPASAGATLRIFSLPVELASEPQAWAPWLARAADLGFGHVLAPVSLLTGDPAADAGRVAALVAACQRQRLGLLVDVDVAQVLAPTAAVHGDHPDWFHALPDPGALPDPRQPAAPLGVRWRYNDDAVAPEALAWWCERLRLWLSHGIAGLRLLSLEAAPPAWWEHLLDGLRAKAPHALWLGWTQGLAPGQLAAFATVGLDYTFCSAEWWDYRAGWLTSELRRLAAVAPPLACAASPFGMSPNGRTGDAASQRRALWFAAACAHGWLLPAQFADGGSAIEREVMQANAWLRARDAVEPIRESGSPKRAPILHVDDAWVGVLRAGGDTAELALFNTRLDRAVVVDLGVIAGGAASTYSGWVDAMDDQAPTLPLDLAPGAVRLLRGVRTRPVTLRTPVAAQRQALATATRSPRIAIEAVEPNVDGGRFAIKRVAGDTVTVQADVFMDGHDVLAVALRWRALDEKSWHEERMQPLGNDRYAGQFTPTRIGRHEYTVQAWRDAYASYRHEIVAKHEAGVAIALEMEEGRLLLEVTAAAAPPARRKPLRALLGALASADDEARYRLLIAQDTGAAMQLADPRPFAVEHASLPLEVDRRAAQFASWYELFPRSQTDDPARHGSFRDVIGRLPAIAAMGFDVLYFPPIHPIGRAFRKGRNNTLTPDEHDPGSPYAIGSAEGGHTAIHPQLGTLEDFRALREAAAAHGLELALDFAIQCSPDHPWLGEHPDWFDWRPDGSLRYAENPPKKYQDIVNVDFYTEGAVPSLWQALCDVVLYWAGEGVRMFRVDNPHTKPYPFWEWLIARVRGQYPDALFLAEAFTRPKPMYRLAKLGFSQSYTYFTWRHSKQEFTDYLTELTQGAPREFFRPHFFVNTPDINPYFLQQSGRSGFLIRAALAATLSGLWGMYSGFELCEAVPIPGKEEYLDSEKYEIKPRDWDAPGNIVAEITRLNRIRREQPALQSHLGVRFLRADNAQVLFFERFLSGRDTPVERDRVLVAINLDPHHAQASDLHLPLADWGVAEDAPLIVEDLLREATLTWRGGRQQVWLGQEMPYAIWRVEG